MYYLGIGEDDGQIYVGGKIGLRHRLHPYPILLPLRFEPFEGMFDHQDRGEFPGRLFMEDSFDPVTKVRRGRVYFGGYTLTRHIEPPHGRGGANASIRMHEYQREPLHMLKGLYGSKLPLVYLGSDDFRSTWKIINIEQDASDTYVLVLKSYRSLGEIPDLKNDAIPGVVKSDLSEYIEHVENSVNRETPHNVVDRCRDAAALILGYLSDAPEKDFSDTINKYSKHESGKKKELVQHAAHTIRFLHTRGKPNTKHKYQTRGLSEEDAQLAVRCLGLILKEVGWAI